VKTSNGQVPQRPAEPRRASRPMAPNKPAAAPEAAAPIQVHCPNPSCARIHLVKGKYAGLRGKCPACASWMYIPRVEHAPSAAAPRPQVPVAMPIAAPKAQAAETPAPARAEQGPTTPKKHFSRPAALCLLLGMLSLGAVAATPYLDPGELAASGDVVKALPTRAIEGIKEDVKPYVIGIPAGAAGLVLLSLLVGLVSGRFGLASLFLVHVSGLVAAALLFLALAVYQQEATSFHVIQEHAQTLRAQGATGEVAPPLGPFVFAGLGGAVGASVLLVLAAVLMHRRWWSRSLGFLWLGGITALAAVWTFKESLGIGVDNPYLPF
jgi:hypothetical protein